MTDGEKMIWAVVFATRYNHSVSRPPHHLCGPTEDALEALGAWEIKQAVSAAEWAADTVDRLREIGPGILEGFGTDYGVFPKWCEITEIDPAVLTRDHEDE